MARLRTWTISAGLHLLLVLGVGRVALVTSREEAPDFQGSIEAVTSDSPPPVEVVRHAPTVKLAAPMESTVRSPKAAAMDAIVSAAPSGSFALAPNFNVPGMRSAMARGTTAALTSPQTNRSELSRQTWQDIKNFTVSWAKNPEWGRGGAMKEREFEFTAYLAQYRGGDWDATVRVENGVITEGSLPNLLYVMTKLSRDKVTGRPQARPLDLSSDAHFEKRPPFVLFTGHRDFVLTDREVENLRRYILLGGCVWGDSSLAGQRSRFDLAFRREMKRVITDVNKPWKAVPETHALFTSSYFPEVQQLPPGMNYRREAMWMLEGMAGEIGALYTANNYGDMFQFGIDERGNLDLSRDENRRMVAVNEAMWWRRGLYFRNVEPKALLACYKLGTNIAVHLMTRFEKHLQRVAP